MFHLSDRKFPELQFGIGLGCICSSVVVCVETCCCKQGTNTGQYQGNVHWQSYSHSVVWSSTERVGKIFVREACCVPEIGLGRIDVS